MYQVGAFEAKTHFSELLERVNVGEQVVITKHGKKIAKLIPYAHDKKPVGVKSVITAMRGLRKKIGKVGLTLEDIKKMKEKGRA